MSFIKKGLKKIWNFVKKYWKEIVIVAAVVFTAGIATVGVAGFSAAMTAAGGGAGGFFSAVGSTMWAGVTATAGSMGIGSGASGTAASLAGVTGQGVGAAAGWGAAGKGLGMTATEVGANLAAQGVTPAMVGEGVAQGAIAQGATAGEAAQAGMAAAKEAAASQIGTTVSAETGSVLGGKTATEVGGEMLAKGMTEAEVVKASAGAAAAGEGMSMGKAMLWSSALQVGGQGVSAWAGAKMNEPKPPLALWGVPISGKEAKGYDYNMTPEIAGPSAPTANEAAQAAQASALASTRSPTEGLMNQSMGGYEGGKSIFERDYQNPSALMA